MNEFVRIVKYSYWRCIANDYFFTVKMMSGFSYTKLQVILFSPPRVILSDGTRESDIRTLSEKICEYKV